MQRPRTAPEATAQGRVAIVGAGPAGLACAGELRRHGHEVTVFDAYEAPGGILRYGIPDYRLPDAVVDAEIADLRSAGVRFELGVRVGESVTLDDLRSRYDATFLAIGLADSVWPDIPGEDLAGVLTANDYLERVNRPGAADLRGHEPVAVVGGGNVAIDAARSALRLGAETVTLVYRRGRAQLPACSGEIHEAELEGVRFVFLASPIAIAGDADGRVRALRCARMRLGEADASGRPRAVPTGEEIEIEADQVILALGSRVEPWLAEAEPSLAVDGRHDRSSWRSRDVTERRVRRWRSRARRVHGRRGDRRRHAGGRGDRRAARAPLRATTCRLGSQGGTSGTVPRPGVAAR